MSRKAVEWAGRQRPPAATDKLVLWALADAMNEKTGLCCPSVAAVAEFTMLERKRVMASMARLERCGLIFDTGDRIGKTRQVKCWRLVILETVPKPDC
ncbi:helix-turn-helix domain-containing protein [Sphingomonas sp. MG17]|uniref:Helix-turn-helix domain-containing protein n=1 Tax=Sphingomonas tagetis TaxID=2949092 RepID=A0A9X2HMI9_9SPHN|nr:helix-turn-helix domain-containing protein [Sphingomonas tagetis]MCP3732029.1 helix-turn-helix domain-containing protein [Sphingomonas tagetis]